MILKPQGIVILLKLVVRGLLPWPFNALAHVVEIRKQQPDGCGKTTAAAGTDENDCGLSASPDFVRWGHNGNCTGLRCRNGCGPCLWRQRRFDEAGRVFDRMHWLHPDDNQGMRALIDEVRAETPRKDRYRDGCHR